MQASRKITIAIVSIYSLVFLALALALFSQAKTDVERESHSAMLMAEALTRQEVSVAQLKTVLDLNRHLSTQLFSATDVDRLGLGTHAAGELKLLYRDPQSSQQYLLITPNPNSEVSEIQATVLAVFGIFLLSLLLTLQSLRVAVQARLQPLQSLCRGLSSIPKGDYHVQVDRGDINEINELIEHYKAMAQSLSRKDRQVIRLRTRLADLMENERRALARELHDNLGQIVTAIAVQSYMLGQQSSNQIFVKKYAKEIQLQCEDIQNCLRSITNQLYPVALGRVGLIAGLKELCESWHKVHKIEVEFSVSGLDLAADLDRDTHIYRIAQEALNNIAKHAETNNASMQIEVGTRTFTMRIADNGVGIKAGFVADSDTLGMASMQDRASLISAKINFDASDQGVLVEVKVPLVNDQDEVDDKDSNIKGASNDQYLIG